MNKHSTAMVSGATTVIGLDLGDRWSWYYGVDAGGRKIQEGRVATTSGGMASWLRGLGSTAVRVVLETGTHAHWVKRLVEEAGHRALVANPRRVRLIYAGRQKSDRLDAAALARLGRLDPQLLYPIRLGSRQAQVDRALVRSREALVRCRTALINSARGQVKALGGRLPACSSESFTKKAKGAIPAELEAAITPLLAAVEALNQQIRVLDGRLREAAERHPATARLQSIPGVGPLTALSFVLAIEDPHRFTKSREVGAYLGLVPRQAQSGDRTPELPITKAGNPLLRKLLVQCAHRILGPFGTDSRLREWGLALAARGGARAKKRAITATARKLAVIMHRVWISDVDYQASGKAA